MPMPQDKLYFIAILPPEDVMDEVTAFKEDMRDNYNSKTALKVMPHITLKAPFRLPAEKSREVLNWFSNIPIGTRPFQVTLKDFGSFNNKHNKVIFVKPVVTELMAGLQKNIITSFRKAFPEISMSTYEHEFKPHMTIAYRDLIEENYEKAWAVYKDKQYSATFTCNSFYLLQHNGLKWEVTQEYRLG
jgi:2'-5' RNA ligase